MSADPLAVLESAGQEWMRGLVPRWDEIRAAVAERLGMTDAERDDTARAWAAGEISGQQCERYIRAQDGARCLHTACISITGMCVHEHKGTVLLCFCCAAAARASRMRCASAGCGETVAVVAAEPLHPSPPEREELIG